MARLITFYYFGKKKTDVLNLDPKPTRLIIKNRTCPSKKLIFQKTKKERKGGFSAAILDFNLPEINCGKRWKQNWRGRRNARDQIFGKRSSNGNFANVFFGGREKREPTSRWTGLPTVESPFSAIRNKNKRLRLCKMEVSQGDRRKNRCQCNYCRFRSFLSKEFILVLSINEM